MKERQKQMGKKHPGKQRSLQEAKENFPLMINTLRNQKRYYMHEAKLLLKIFRKQERALGNLH